MFLRLAFITIMMLAAASIMRAAAAAEVITSISGVRDLTPERASLKVPMEVVGQVMRVSRWKFGLFLHDEQSGIYVALDEKLRKINFQQGQIIRVTGETAPGAFTPHVIARDIELLGTKALPEPLRPDKEAFFSPALDCRWIEVRGVATNLKIEAGSGVAYFDLECFGTSVSMVVPLTKYVEDHGERFLNQIVIVKGVAATIANSRRQMIDRFINVHSLDNVVVAIDENEPLRLTTIDKLLILERSSLENVRVRGTVIHVEGNRIFLRSDEGNLKVLATAEDLARSGQLLEVSGTVMLEPFSPGFRARKIELIEAGPEPKPVAISLQGEEAFPYSWNHGLVALEAKLLDVRRSSDAYVLNLVSEGRFFEATLADRFARNVELLPGSTLALSGVCELRSSRASRKRECPDGLGILLRNEGDLRVIAKPSWWTLERIAYGLGVAALVALVSLLGMWFLRRRVIEQTGIISRQMERDVTLRERQRLARELHDSLEQNMSSLAMQLGTAERKWKAREIDGLGTTLEVARKLLAYCQRESRESIYDLRQPMESDGGATSQWFDDLLLSEAGALGVKINYKTEGAVYALEGKVRQHLNKIVREASFNGMRHGKAKHIVIFYRFAADGLEVTVTDDGTGFDVAKEPPKGHYGLYGMRERAQRIGAKLVIESNPGTGTTIHIHIPKVTHGN